MIEVDTHLLASVSGYTTQGASPGITQSERSELEQLVHGQADSEEIHHGLAKRPTACLRALHASGRFALSRVLPGQPDSAGRRTVAVCSIVMSSQACQELVASDVWNLLQQKKLWTPDNFVTNRTLRLPPLAPVRRSVTQRDVMLYDTWVRAMGQDHALAVLECSPEMDAALVNLAQVLDPADRLRLTWGCRLLSTQVPVPLATFALASAVSGMRRPSVTVSPVPVSTLGREAMARALGGQRLPRVLAPASRSEDPAYDLAPLPSADNDLTGLLEPVQPEGSEARTSATTPQARLTRRLESRKLGLVLAVWAVLVLALLGAFGGFWLYKTRQPPAAISQVTATAKGTSALIQWPASQGAASYEVLRYQPDATDPQRWGASERISEVKATPTAEAGASLSCQDPGPRPGRGMNRYEVVAISPYGIRGPPVSSAPFDGPLHWEMRPSIQEAGGKALIRWKPVPGAVRYEVSCQFIPPRSDSLKEPPTANPEVSVELLGGQTLTATVIAYMYTQGDMGSVASEPITLTRAPSDRPPAVKLTGIRQENQGLMVDWSPSLGADAYRLERRLDESGAPPNVENITDTHYVISPVPDHATITVVAVRSAGQVQPVESQPATFEWYAPPRLEVHALPPAPDPWTWRDDQWACRVQLKMALTAPSKAPAAIQIKVFWSSVAPAGAESVAQDWKELDVRVKGQDSTQAFELPLPEVGGSIRLRVAARWKPPGSSKDQTEVSLSKLESDPVTVDIDVPARSISSEIRSAAKLLAGLQFNDSSEKLLTALGGSVATQENTSAIPPTWDARHRQILSDWMRASVEACEAASRDSLPGRQALCLSALLHCREVALKALGKLQKDRGQQEQHPKRLREAGVTPTNAWWLKADRELARMLLRHERVKQEAATIDVPRDALKSLQTTFNEWQAAVRKAGTPSPTPSGSTQQPGKGDPADQRPLLSEKIRTKLLPSATVAMLRCVRDGVTDSERKDLEEVAKSAQTLADLLVLKAAELNAQDQCECLLYASRRLQDFIQPASADEPAP